jgi:hypothetical protein
MPTESYIDPEQPDIRHNKILRGMDPDYRYPANRIAAAAALKKNLHHFISVVGEENVGFMLLTFREPIDIREARHRLNNAWRRYFRAIFGHSITVVETTKAWRPHIHMIVELFDDIRNGFDFQAYADYRHRNEVANGCGPRLSCKERRALRDAIPANPFLRAIWHTLDAGLTDFGFGPVFDLFPIETNEDALAKYLSKQFLGGIPRQRACDKGARLITYSRGCPRAVPPGWKPPSIWWKRRIEALLRVFMFRDTAQLQERLGKRWAYPILQLMHALEERRPERWPDMWVRELALVIRELICLDRTVKHYVEALLPEVETMIDLTYIPPGPPPPPPTEVP